MSRAIASIALNPMTKVDLDAVVRRLVEAYRPERVILYGSRAYGEPGEDSDVDLLVIKETDEEWWQRKYAVVRCLGDVTAADVDVRVITPAELAGWLERGNQFYRRAGACPPPRGGPRFLALGSS